MNLKKLFHKLTHVTEVYIYVCVCKEKFHEFTQSVMDEIDIMATLLLLQMLSATAGRSFTFWFSTLCSFTKLLCVVFDDSDFFDEF